MTRYCAKCGSELDDDTRFCTSCGAPVDTVPETKIPAPQDAQPVSTTAHNTKTRAIAIGVVVAAVVIVAVVIAVFALMQGPGPTDESNAVTEQAQDEAAEDAIEERTIVTDHFKFVMPESWVDKVTWAMEHNVYPSPTGNGPDQDLTWYYFYLVGGDRFTDQVMSILVTNDAMGQLGQTSSIGEFKTSGGLDGYICFADWFLMGGTSSGLDDALIASLQSGGQVHYAVSDSMAKKEADLKTIEAWMKANVVPRITAVSSSSASPASTDDLGFKGVTSVRASSTLPTDSINTRDYSASSIMDGDEWTCWAENAPGPGIGEYVAFSGDGEQTFHGFKIRNGHQYSIQLYYKNARATSLSVIVDGEVMETVPLKEEGLNWQTITFAKPYTGKEIALRIDSAESGSSYDDCCIAEVEFF
ncbi:MAG: zinc-ribbon domain-containing protein [Coriobacteriales bacterium]